MKDIDIDEVLLFFNSLPFQLPKQYADKPYLTGRAVVEMTVEREGGSFEVNGKEASREGTIKAVLDGYSAPLTSGDGYSPLWTIALWILSSW